MEKSQILMISVALIVLLFVGFFVYNQIKEGKIFLQPRNPSDPRTDIPKTPTCLGSPKYEYCEGNLRLYSPECNVDKWIYENQECAYGCANGTCLGKKCPATCDDGNLCTTSFCNASTNFDCKYTYHYFAVKEYGKFKVSESNSLGDVTLYISEASFNELDESSNICPVLKELME